jgi:hypothetical protein
LQSLVVLVVVGLAAQLVDGSLGMAYGVTSTTLLVASGITPAMASGSVHLAEMGTTLLSGASHWRFGNVDWKVVFTLGLPGAIGAFFGATVLSSLSTERSRPWMAVILLTLGLVLLVRFAWSDARSGRQYLGFRTRFLAPLGLVAGFVDASGGGGWGPIATPTMLIANRTELRKVIGSVSAAEFLVSLAASAGFLLALGSGGVDWRIAGALLVGGAVAAPFAAWLVRVVAPRVLGTFVGGLIVITNTRTLLGQAQLTGGGRLVIYLTIVAAWSIAVMMAVRRYRRDGPAPAPAPLVEVGVTGVTVKD